MNTAAQHAPITVGKMPHFNENGDLVISAAADPQFRYWAGGQSIWQTLADLDAPAATIRRYAARSDAPLHMALAVRDCKGELVDLPELSFCCDCGFFVEKPSQTLKDILGF